MSHGIAPPGFRIPPETSVGAVTLQVSDLSRSLAYYTGVLGFHLDRQSQDAAVLTAQGDRAPLVHLVARAGVHRVRRRSTLGLYHFAILLPERPSLGRFLAHLSKSSLQAGMSDHLVSEAIYLTDPDGLGIEVYADRSRSTWRCQGGQLTMGTHPLDVDDLLAAGGGEPWRGMPSGTVIGHVHLHVGDLAAAEAFYHSALGFDKVNWEFPGALFLSAGGYHHHLGTNTWVPGSQGPADQPRLLSWDIVVPTAADARAAARSLEAAGHTVAADENGWSATDPWGTPLHIVFRGQNQLSEPENKERDL